MGPVALTRVLVTAQEVVVEPSHLIGVETQFRRRQVKFVLVLVGAVCPAAAAAHSTAHTNRETLPKRHGGRFWTRIIFHWFLCHVRLATVKQNRKTRNRVRRDQDTRSNETTFLDRSETRSVRFVRPETRTNGVRRRHRKINVRKRFWPSVQRSFDKPIASFPNVPGTTPPGAESTDRPSRRSGRKASGDRLRNNTSGRRRITAGAVPARRPGVFRPWRTGWCPTIVYRTSSVEFSGKVWFPYTYTHTHTYYRKTESVYLCENKNQIFRPGLNNVTGTTRRPNRIEWRMTICIERFSIIERPLTTPDVNKSLFSP